MPRIKQQYVIDAKDNTARAIESAKRRFSSLDKVIRRTFAGLAAGIVGTASFSGFKRTINQIDEISKSAKNLGLSVEAFDSLRFLAGQAGVETERFNRSMLAFNNRVGEARIQTGSLNATLEKYDSSLAAAVRETSSLDQALLLIADAFEQETDQSKRAALAKAAFSTVSKNMTLFLGQGSTAIKTQQKELKDLGAVLSGEFSSSAETANDNLSLLQKILDTQMIEAMSKAAPLFERLTSWLIDVVKWGGRASTKLAEFFALFDDTPEARIAQLNRQIETLRKQSQSWLGTLSHTPGWFDFQIKQRQKQIAELKKEMDSPGLIIPIKGSTAPDEPPSPVATALKEIEEFSVLQKTHAQEFMDSWKDTAYQVDIALVRAFSGASDALTEFVTTGKLRFREFALSILQDLVRIQIQQNLAGIFGYIAGGAATFGTSQRYGTTFGSQQTRMLAAQDAAFKASGGPVSAGRPYIVGEKGAELFIPKQSGTIVPNGGGLNQNITINAQGADANTVLMLRRVVAEAARSGYEMVLSDMQRGGPIRRMI